MTTFAAHHQNLIDPGFDYPLLGELREVVAPIVPLATKGQPLFSACIEKAQTVARCLANSRIEVGGLTVYNVAKTATYGFEYNPQWMEFHAWVRYNQYIIDAALPGVILRGLMIADEDGPFLEGRDPVVLAGTPPDWLEYKPVESYEEFILRMQNFKFQRENDGKGHSSTSKA